MGKKSKQNRKKTYRKKTKKCLKINTEISTEISTEIDINDVKIIDEPIKIDDPIILSGCNNDLSSTIFSYIKKAREINEWIEKFAIVLSPAQIEDKISILHSDIKTLQTTAYYLADTANLANKILINKKSKKKKQIILHKNNDPDPFPTETSIGTLLSVNPEQKINIVDDFYIPIINIKNSKEIPVTNVYFIEDLQQFAINIAGIVIRGDLCNIDNYQSKKSIRCEYGIRCKKFVTDDCDYFHDNTDYITLNKPIKRNIRTITPGNFIYSNKKKDGTYLRNFMRHIGSYDMIKADLSALKKNQYRDEIYNRECQLMHDLLIYLILNGADMLERYSHWREMPKRI